MQFLQQTLAFLNGDNGMGCGSNFWPSENVVVVQPFWPECGVADQPFADPRTEFLIVANIIARADETRYQTATPPEYFYNLISGNAWKTVVVESWQVPPWSDKWTAWIWKKWASTFSSVWDVPAGSPSIYTPQATAIPYPGLKQSITDDLVIFPNLDVSERTWALAVLEDEQPTVEPWSRPRQWGRLVQAR
jgi:hypothetical protein